MFRRSAIWALLALIVIVSTPLCSTAASPQLVVNIIVGSLRSSDLSRYSENFSEGGFRRLIDGGVYFTSAYHDYAICSTASGIATLTTGAQPASHGVVGENWWNYVDSSRVSLIGDSKAHPIEFSIGAESCSPHRLVAPTIGDMLLASNPESKNITIALDALSAVVATGKRGIAYWAERNKTHWTTSSAYTDRLSDWLGEYNRTESNDIYRMERWTPLYDAQQYKNDEVAVIEDIKGKSTKLLSDIDLTIANSKIGHMRYTPAGNSMVFELARRVVAQEHLASNSTPDILNIVLDTPRYIATTYGPESMEYEDMLYRLDLSLEEFLTYLYAQVDDPSEIIVVLSSPHGTSPSYNPIGYKPQERFNVRQAEVLVNAFLGARYGSENYVLGFANRAIYLNHRLILDKHLSLDAIREEVATFMLQLRGVASTLSASSLRNTSFAEGRSRLLQQSFYATRSGDIIVDLQPGWTIENSDRRSAADAGYNYDREVPVIIYGGLEPRVVERPTSIVEVAPTITSLLGIERPWASTAQPSAEVKQLKNN